MLKMRRLFFLSFALRQVIGQDLQCQIQGQCIGLLTGFTIQDSYDDCLQICKGRSECSWFTFTEFNECFEYADCSFIDNNCVDCFTGQKECKSELDFYYLMVVGGRDSAKNKVEIINLSGANKTCLPLSDYPGSEESTIGIFIDGKPMVCGGYFPTSKRCFTYNATTDAWNETYSMSLERAWAAGVKLSEDKWWISGGYDTHGVRLASTEVFIVGEGFAPYVDLPEPRDAHNIVSINETHLMLLGGGYPGSSKAWMFDVTTEEWSPIQDMMTSRWYTHAGLVKYPDGRQAVLVAGGDSLNSTEVFDLEEQTWKMGPDFPRVLSVGASVQYGETFLVVGGYILGAYQDVIYSFDVTNESWVELPEKLEFERFYLSAFLVPNDYIGCVIKS